MTLPLLLAAAWLSAGARAQTVETEGARPACEGAARVEAASLATEAGLAGTKTSSGTVTYAQVMADPDDIDLNYRWARAQVRRGDLKGASATLRRLLLVDPNQAKVRLFLAIVLFRLDDLAEAREEFESLQKLPLDPEVRSQVAAFLREIDLRQKRTRAQGVIGLGVQRDDNRNYAPSSGQRLFHDTPIPLAADSLARADESLVTVVSAQLTRDLGAEAGHEATSSLTCYRSDQRRLSTLDLRAFSWRGGARLNFDAARVTPLAQFDYVQLGRGAFLRAWGAGARVERKVAPRTQVFAAGVLQYQGYGRTRDVPTADERSGNQWDLTLGADVLASPTMKLQAGYTRTFKNAAQRYDAFDRDSVSVQDVWLAGKGMFLLSGVTFGFDRYDSPDEVLSSKRRRDTNWRVGATFGAPLSLLASGLRDLTWTVTAEHYRSDSNLLNYRYHNDQVSTSVTYRWDSGL